MCVCECEWAPGVLELNPWEILKGYGEVVGQRRWGGGQKHEGMIKCRTDKIEPLL